MDKRKLKKIFDAFASKAQSLVIDKDLTLDKIKQGFTKATANEGALSSVWHKLQLLFGLAKDYYNGSYINVDRKTIVTIIASLLYFISPIDLIPDFLLGIGLIDDVFIIGYVYNKVAKELVKYEDWKGKQKKMIHI